MVSARLLNQPRFSHEVFLQTEPAVLSQGPWHDDQAFLSNLIPSWQSQYADYLGAERARRLVARLLQSGDIFSHDPQGTLIAFRGDEKVGVAALRELPGLSLITLLEVVPSYQGQGIARQLIQALATSEDPLMTHVSIHRPGLREFYELMGFSLIQRGPVNHYGHQLLVDVMLRQAEQA